jgi:hypothetical protein
MINRNKEEFIEYSILIAELLLLVERCNKPAREL